MPDFRLIQLGADDLARAYPLVRGAVRVSQERWELYGRGLLEAGGGIAAVSGPDSCLHGIAAWRLQGSLRHEKVLAVELLVTFELSGDAPIRTFLCDALGEIARALGCESLVCSVAAQPCFSASSGARLAWEKLGLRADTVAFVRSVA
jgi:hypothetical protein